MNKEKCLLYLSKRAYTKHFFLLLNNAGQSAIAHCPTNAPLATILPIVKSGKWRAPHFNAIKYFIDKRMIDMNVRPEMAKREREGSVYRLGLTIGQQLPTSEIRGLRCRTLT